MVKRGVCGLDKELFSGRGKGKEQKAVDQEEI